MRLRLRVKLNVEGSAMTAIIVRYIVGGLIAALAAKGVIDGSVVESATAGFVAVFTGLVEYWKARS